MVDQSVVTTLVTSVIGICTTLITTVVIPYTVKYFSAKTKNERVQALVVELGQAASNAVSAVEQTYVKKCKSDGNWGTDEMVEACNRGINTFIEHVSSSTYKYLINQGYDIDSVARDYIESEICNRSLMKDN